MDKPENQINSNKTTSRTQKLQSSEHFQEVLIVLKDAKKKSKKEIKKPQKLEKQILEEKLVENKTLKYLRDAKNDLQQRIHNLNTR